MMLSRRTIVLSAACAAIVACAVFIPALLNDFIFLDDPQFVSLNFNIRSFDSNFFKWIFTNRETQWTPVRWISHAIDYKIWGLNPLGHHLTNIILHSLNTFLIVILFFKLMLYTRPKDSPEKGDKKFVNSIVFAGLVTGILWGVHPIHVESVAWVTERKDVLYAFFFLLSLIMYLNYSRSADTKQKTIRYLACLACFLAAVMSKATAAILPLVLILLDVYPLKRLSIQSGYGRLSKALIDKIPFFVISLAIGLINIGVHEELGYFVTLQTHTITERVMVAFQSLAVYIFRILWPFHLTYFSPYPEDISFFTVNVLGSFVFIAGITVFSIFQWRKGARTYLLCWLFYALMLLPVLLFRVSWDFIGDRHAYMASLGPIMLIGIGIFIGWGKSDSRMKALITRKNIVVVCVLILTILGFVTVKQTVKWKDSITLLTSIIKDHPDSPLGYVRLGHSYFNMHNYQDAERSYLEAIRIAKTVKSPQLSEALYRLGFMYLFHQKISEAQDVIAAFEAVRKDDYRVKTLKGYSRYLTDDFPAAVKLYQEVLKSGQVSAKYDQAQIITLAGDAYREMGDFQSALDHYRKALKLISTLATPYQGIGKIFMTQGDFATAEKYFNRALQIESENFVILTDRAKLALLSGKGPEAAFPFIQKAVSMNPPLSEPYVIMGTVLTSLGAEEEAKTFFDQAIALKAPEYLVAYNKAFGYFLKGDRKGMRKSLQELLRLKNVPVHIKMSAQNMLSKKQ
jgi:tetratricopeptide (TPR) repeat protein